MTLGAWLSRSGKAQVVPRVAVAVAVVAVVVAVVALVVALLRY